MRISRYAWIVAVLLAGGTAMFGCGDDETNTVFVHDTTTVFDTTRITDTLELVDPNRVYVQIERLGNPLTSEVFLAKREHGHHNAGVPAEDAADFTDDIEGLVTAFGRPQSLADVISGALLPDMLIVRTQGDPQVAGWLTWALAPNGYGGRLLTDDVVDVGLMAIFGSVLGDTTGQIPSLTSDNIDANDATLASAFPYLGDPH